MGIKKAEFYADSGIPQIKYNNNIDVRTEMDNGGSEAD